MKILNINSYYYSSTVHEKLQKALMEQPLTLFTYVPVSKGYIARDECQGSKEKNLTRVECYNKIDRFIFHLKHRKILKNIIKKIDINQYDCFHAHSLFSNGYIAMKTKEKFNKPYIVAVRDTDVNTFFKKMIHLRGLGNQILKEAAGVVFLSSSYRNTMIDKYVKDKYKDSVLAKSYVIPSGIDKFWLENKGSPKKIESRQIKLLSVGAITKRKNILTTIKVIEILKGKGYHVTLTVVGKVIDKSIYKEIQKKHFVKHISLKPKNELLKIYREHDIFVMPSITETFGLVYPEAMSQGLPVIYTRGQGFDGQFNEGEVGYSVRYNSAEEIERRVRDIIENYEAISKNCIAKVNRFDWDKITNEYINMYLRMNKKTIV